MGSDRKLQRDRTTGVKGTPILMHRSLRKIPFGPSALVSMLLFPLFFDLLLLVKIDVVLQLWAGIFDFWLDRLAVGEGRLIYKAVYFFGVPLGLPLPDYQMVLPSETSVLGNIVVCAVAFFVVGFLPRRFLPVIYMLRVCLLLQISASVYFMINPTQPPYDLPVYLSGILTVGLYLLFLISPVLAGIYYVFDFALWRKFLVTAAMMVYFIIAAPFLVLLHAMVICFVSVLMMPVMYFVFGAFLNMLMFLGWYSWAMTWGIPDDV